MIIACLLVGERQCVLVQAFLGCPEIREIGHMIYIYIHLYLKDQCMVMYYMYMELCIYAYVHASSSTSVYI